MRFRTWIQHPFDDWNEDWLFEVSHHAKTIWVRIPGLAMGERARGRYHPDDTDIRQWESSMSGLRTRPGQCAYTVLSFRSFENVGGPRGLWAYFRWADWDRVADRMSYMLRTLEARTGLGIGIHAEDFGARWAMLSGFRPDLWVLDNPVIGVDEALDRFSRQLSRPGFVRRSRWSALNSVDIWRPHIPPDQWLGCSRPLRGRHMKWRRSIRPRALTPVTRLAAAEWDLIMARQAAGAGRPSPAPDDHSGPAGPHFAD